jgi:serine-type D-Ala-D-Ala carboxypeptidase (penicillin-binding protein 5/6)
MRRIAALLLAVLFLAVPAISAEKKAPAKKAAPAKTKTVTPESPGVSKPFTVPNENDPDVFPFIEAQAAILCDASTGRVLYEKNADDVRAVASTQKLLTALIIAEDGGLNDDVKVQASDGMCEPTKLGIKAGETYKRYDLLKILLVKSMNDVARCLARDNAGSIDAFAAKMNAKAREMGMRRSNFVNPNGLTEEGQYSTARDMARLGLFAYRNRVLRGIMATRNLAWKYPSGKVVSFENTNKLMKSFGLCNGMKTGYTEAAGHCLMASANSGGKHVICVVLGDRRRQGIWNDSYKLLNWGLNQMREGE